MSFSGGGAGSVSSDFTSVVSSTPSFGVVGFDGTTLNEDGTPDTQAGSHPYALTISLGFTSRAITAADLVGLGVSGTAGAPVPDGNVKDIAVNVPPGLVGDPTAIPQCPQQDLSVPDGFASACPAASQVGLISLRTGNFTGQEYPVFNMVPPPGEPAQFGAFVRAGERLY